MCYWDNPIKKKRWFNIPFLRGSVSAMRPQFKRTFDTAVSVGCGSAAKELELVKAGIVKHFTLVDPSSIRCAIAERSFRNAGFHNSFSIINEPFGNWLCASFDLVYWNNSLHHMPSASDAITWSIDVMRSSDSGIYIEDYCGPDRFKSSAYTLSVINNFIKQNFLGIPEYKPPEYIEDPSEACDSLNIIPSLSKTFDSLKSINIGGNIFHFALSHIIDCGAVDIDYNLIFEADQYYKKHTDQHYFIFYKNIS